MIVLSTLNKLLAQVLSPPSIHTAVVFTTAGDLISFAVLHPSPKDDVRVLVGFSSEIWSESKHDGGAMVDSELGRVIVLPVVPPFHDQAAAEELEGEFEPEVGPEAPVEAPVANQATSQVNARPQGQNEKDPLLLLAIKATDDMEWGELQLKAHSLAAHLSKPLAELQEILSFPAPSVRKSSRRG